MARWEGDMIVAVLGEKGGTGKTTFATNLAGMRAIAGRDVLIMDADRQGSASYWAEAREKQDGPPVASVQKFGTGLVRTVADMARRYSDVVIDIAAGDSREIEGALRTAQRAIIPIQPAGLDVWTLGIIDERVGEAWITNPQLKAFVVINRASPNPRDNDVTEAKEAICECENFVVSDVVVRERVAVKRAAPKGLTVAEYRPLDPKAVEEMDALYRLAFGEG
jgi:chromosome partitioning protein